MKGLRGEERETANDHDRPIVLGSRMLETHESWEEEFNHSSKADLSEVGAIDDDDL